MAFGVHLSLSENSETIIDQFKCFSRSKQQCTKETLAAFCNIIFRTFLLVHLSGGGIDEKNCSIVSYFRRAEMRRVP